jgi:hypothetical protein
MFTPGEQIHCQQDCAKNRKDPHYFHIVCQDILIDNYKQEIDPIRRLRRAIKV